MSYYPIKLNLSYKDFIKEVKNIYTCCAFIDGKYISITDEIRGKIKTGQLLITQYHDMPLGEVIYLEPNAQFQ